MSSTGRNLLLVLLLAAAGAGVLGVTSLLRKPNGNSPRGAQAGDLREQIAALDREVRALRDRRAAQELGIAAQSNRAEDAAARVEEE